MADQEEVANLRTRLALAERRLAENARSENARRESETRDQLLMRSWAQAVWETDPSGFVIADSPTWRAYTGQTLHQWLGYGWLDAIHPDDRAYAERQWREAMAACTLVNAEFRLQAPDGGWRWTNVLAAPVRDGVGVITKWAGLNIDIDARKRAEAGLRDSEERYRTLFESIDEGFCVIEMLFDTQGRPVDFQFVEINPIFVQQAGFAVAPGQRIREIAPTHEQFWFDVFGRIALTGEPERFQHGAETFDRFYDVYAFRVDAPEQRRVAVLFRDITERREWEERQKVLLAELQHRVRNILAVTRSMISRSNDGERLTEEYVQHLEGRIAALSRTQVLLTRSAGARLELQDLIRDELLAQVASDEQFTLEGPDVPLSSKAAEVLTLAIHELATNATKFGAFSPSSGRLTISWAVEELDGQPWLALDWEEAGVPIVRTTPRRQGFGTELVSRRVPYELKGHGHLELRPGGLFSHIEFPLTTGGSILQTNGISR